MQLRRCLRGARPDAEFSYNGVTGHWWQQRAADGSHQRAYQKIADFIGRSSPRPPRRIVDYACGPGHMLSLLSRRFPNARLIGLDGSSLLLDAAEARLARRLSGNAARISLIETPLPRRLRLDGPADLLVYCFPNMTPAGADESGRAFALSSKDVRIARCLAEAVEPEDHDADRPDPAAVQDTLEYGRRISRNLRQLLRRGGLCIRAEYATMQRHEWSPLSLLQASFEEGSLDMAVGGLAPRPWFRVLASSFFRSQVLEDVYQQTGDANDRNGGYLITVLRAL